MKNLTKIFMAVVAGMFAFSCVTDTTEDLGIKVDGQKGVTELALSLEESRTHLGEKAEGVYPLYWSEGDAIAVNGVVSNPLVAGGEATATFSFAEEVKTPLHIVYPASAVATVEGEETEAPAATASAVNFLAEQPYTVGTFAPQAAPMYGYAAELPETGVQLNHLTGVLRLAIAGNGEKVTSIKAVAQNGKIAGPFTVDCTTGELTPSADAVNTVTVTFAEPLVLGAEAAPIYLTVPAGNYGTFLITVNTEAHGKMTIKFNSHIKPIKAGTVREFSEFVYEANTLDEEAGTFLIDSEEALIEFAKIAKAFYPRTLAKVVANLDMTGKEWTPIDFYGADATFDGGSAEGYTIKGLSAPLFNVAVSNIKNVKLTDIDYAITTGAYSGAIVCQLYDGLVENCSVEGKVNINNTTLAEAAASYSGVNHGGLVGRAVRSTIKNCTNDIDITITSLTAPTLNVGCTVGGLVGGVSVNCSIEGLTNNGDITYVGTVKLGNTYISGIVGKNDDSNGQNDFVAFNNCTNNGNISTAKGSASQGEILLSGITGRLEINEDVVCDKLINTGDITLNGACTGTRLSGAIGYTARASLTNCSNSGNIAINTGAQTPLAYLAGLMAGTIYADKLDNCHNTGSLTIGDGVAFTGAVRLCGCFVTTANDTTKTEPTAITNCTNRGAISIGNCSNTNAESGGRLYIGGVVGTMNDGDMSNCINYPTGTITIKTGNWAAEYMVGGLVAYVGVNNATCVASTVADSSNQAELMIAPVGDAAKGEIGGITGEAYYNKKGSIRADYIRVTNSGNITLKGKFTGGGHPWLGGLLGINNHDNILMKDCVNSGNITNEATASPNIGGFVGRDGNNKEFVIDGCTNSGNINYNVAATSGVYAGGFIGHRNEGSTIIKNSVNEGAITVANQTLAKSDYSCNVAGFVASNSIENLTVTNCTNGKLNDTTGKGNLTLGNCDTGIALGGIVGRCDKAPTISGCKNYATIKQNGFGGYDKTKRAHISGILGNCSVGGIQITECENHGTVEYVSPNPRKDARTDVAGIVATTVSTGNLIKGCKNYGSILYKAKKTNAGEVTVAGITGCPQSTTIVENCENHGLIHASGATTSGYDIGGIAGGPSGAAVEFLNCKNYGEVKQSGAAGGSTYVGGIIGYGYSFHVMNGCENHGPVTILNTTAKSFYVGGLVGWARIASGNGTAAVAHTIKNSGNYYNLTFTGKAGTYSAGGLFGTINNEDAEMSWDEISGLKNVANITFDCTASTPRFGGMIGYAALNANCPVGALNNLDSFVCYGDIKAIGMEGKVGAILGVDRSENIIVKNAQLGGNMVFSETVEEIEDPEGGEPQVTVTNINTPIDASSYFKYIYTSAITEDQATEDGCEALATKPAVPVYTPAE